MAMTCDITASIVTFVTVTVFSVVPGGGNVAASRIGRIALSSLLGVNQLSIGKTWQWLKAYSVTARATRGIIKCLNAARDCHTSLSIVCVCGCDVN